jgi:hypothetical protein
MRRDIEGRNLERDFNQLAPVDARQASHAPLPLAPREFRGGAWHWPHTYVWYNRMVHPAEFLQIYSTSILAAGGNEAVMANYFPVALTGMARS